MWSTQTGRPALVFAVRSARPRVEGGEVALLLQPVAAVDDQRLAGDPGGIRGAERGRPPGDLLGRPEPPGRDRLRDARPVLLGRPERGPGALGVRRARADAVDPDPVRAPTRPRAYGSSRGGRPWPRPSGPFPARPSTRSSRGRSGSRRPRPARSSVARRRARTGSRRRGRCRRPPASRSARDPRRERRSCRPRC